MNTPETINIEKYAHALNNLIGVDSAYMAGDKDVDAIVEVIVAAKKLENRVKELTEESQKWQKAYDIMDSACRELSSKCDELTEEIKDLEAEYDRVYEQAEADIHGNIADGGTSCHWCQDKTKADTVRKMQEKLQEEFSQIMIVRSIDNDDPNMDSDDVWDALDRVAKELLED